jgi:hypothetical protein
MLVLGLDPSLTGFGWAIHDTEAEGKARCPDRGRWSTSAKDMFVSRYMHMRESVRNLVRETGIKTLGVESPIYGELYSEGMYGLYLYVSEALFQEGCDVAYFSPPQTKAHARRFLGRPMKPVKWKMGKPDMIEGAKKDTGGAGRWSADEADAYWAARTGARFWMFFEGRLGLDDLTEDERHQFTKVHTFQRGRKAGKTVRSGLMYREDDRFFRWSKTDTE